MAIDWQGIVTTIGSTAVIVAGLSWVGKTGVEAWLARDLENHKRELERASQRELEHLRLTLRLEEFRQSRLLARQAAVIAGVFAHLDRLHTALLTLVTPLHHEGGNIKELRSQAIEAFNAFGKYYFPRGIWLDEPTCTAINQLHVQLTTLLYKLQYNTDEAGMPADRGLWLEAFNRIKDEIPMARGLLDRRFRPVAGGRQ